MPSTAPLIPSGALECEGLREKCVISEENGGKLGTCMEWVSAITKLITKKEKKIVLVFHVNSDTRLALCRPWTVTAAVA